MATAKKWEKVMFTETEEIDVLHDHHLIIVNRVECAVEELVNVLLIPLRHEPEHLLDAFRRPHQAVTPRFLPKHRQHLRHEILDFGELGWTSVALHTLLVLDELLRLHCLTRRMTAGLR